ncbi:MAG: hypothetical protein AAGK97_15575, partial [Bacteroidota bacterium]
MNTNVLENLAFAQPTVLPSLSPRPIGSDTGARPTTNMDNRTLFRNEYDAVIDDAALLFPNEGEENVRDSFIAKKRDELLIKYGFLSSPAPTNASNNRPISDVEKRALVVKHFVQTCNKYNEKTESMNEFFDRIERKFNAESVGSTEKLNILEILLPGSYFQPYEANLSEDEQYALYKMRALIKAKCTPVDVLFKTVNLTFSAQDSFEHIYDQTKYAISKCNDVFPLHTLEELSTWILFLKGIPKGIRLQMANECRPESLSELKTSLKRFASSRSRSIGSYFCDFKPKNDTQTSNLVKDSTSSSNSQVKPKEINSSVKPKFKVKKCSFCSRPGHKEKDCWLKHPEKKPVANKSVKHAFRTKPDIYRDGVEFFIEGKLNHQSLSEILIDSGATIAAVNA